MKLKQVIKLSAIASILALASINITQAADTEKKYSDLPKEKEWKKHAKDLGLFWNKPAVKNNKYGRFSTWLCNNGTNRNNRGYCNDNTPSPPQLIKSKIFKRDYTRMISRQTYAYGVLFNLTGNEQYLNLHQKGVDFLLNKAQDPKGGFYSWFIEANQKGPERDARTTQDLSYALLGLAMNAYLTHNPEIIKVIQKQQKYIYKYYYDKAQDLLLWTKKDFENDKHTQLELVGQLDQLNAYLILTWRLIPEEDRDAWTKVITDTVKIINTHFYDKEKNIFYGCIDNSSCKTPTGRHMDFGHRSKTFWMEYLVGLALEDQDIINFAKKGMIETLDAAINSTKDHWYESPASNNLASWWVYAELDQAMLNLALSKEYPIYKTLYTWINKYTDKVNGELNWGMKTNFWKNGFHSTEHTLIGYILSQGIKYNDCAAQHYKNSPDIATCMYKYSTTLYYAPYNTDDKLKFFPYLYDGVEINRLNYGRTLQINYSNIKPMVLKK
ncbi:MAG: hypothetical protein ACI4V7_10515 [Succinivibrionaceae bacterium]